MKIEKFLRKALKQAAKKYIHKINTIDTKSDFDFVTEVDKAIENFLIQKIKQFQPDAKFYGEETHNGDLPKGCCWVIDPIDGTGNFINGNKDFGIQVALIDNKQILAGAIYLPKKKEMWIATLGNGTTLNGKKVIVNQKTKTNSFVALNDFPHNDPKRAKLLYKIIGKVWDKFAKIKFYSAACVEFTNILKNITDAYISSTNKIWDIAPGIIICQEAGCKVTNWKGQKWTLGFDNIIVAKNQKDLNVIKSAIKQN